MRNISPEGEICCFLCSACNITHVVSTVKRRVLIFFNFSPIYLADKFFYQSVYFIRLVRIGIMTSILYPKPASRAYSFGSES